MFQLLSRLVMAALVIVVMFFFLNVDIKLQLLGDQGGCGIGVGGKFFLNNPMHQAAPEQAASGAQYTL